MSAYAEKDRLRHVARSLYLEIRALGLELVAHEDPGEPSGYALELIGLRSLSPSHADRLFRRAEAVTQGLLWVMWADWDPELEAKRKEGSA